MFLVALVPAVLCAGLAPVSGSEEQAAEASVFADEFAAARESGEPVEILSERTLTDTVFANPSGTFTRESASAPVRVKSGKFWEDIDLSLEQSGGVLRPKAALGDIEISAGGSGPLLSMTTGSADTSLTWPTELPTPSVEGPSATYRDVFPDVDLKLTVSDVGVSQVLVVHTADAAANPALRSLDLATDVSGGEIDAKDGGYVVKDEIGRTVGVATAPVMWDSSGTLLDADRKTIPDTSEEAIEQRSTGPAHGDDVSDVALEISGDSLVLKPEADALTGDDVAYPVYIDPVATSSTPQAWAMVFKQHPNTSFYKWTDSEGQGVGYQNYNGVSTKRLFFQHSISSVTKTKIIDATFKARMNWSASCTTRAVKVYRVSSVTSSRTWNNQPSWGDYQDSKSYSAGWSGCNPSGRDVVWDVTPGVTDAAAEGRTVIALGMRVSDEGDPLTWRRFRHTTVLRVEYNRLPYTPSSLTIGGKACTSTTVPLLRAQTVAPAMSAIVSDPDGQNVRGRFQWNSGTAVDGSQSSSAERTSAYVTKGSRVSMPLPVATVNGTMPSGTWSFRVRAQDSGGALGRYSGECTFKIDNSPASEPQIKNYPGQEDENDRWLAGTSRTVEFWPAEGKASDTAGYAFTIDKDQAPAAKTSTPTSSDKSMTVTLPASGQAAFTPGLHVLRLWAYDAAGNRSTTPAVLEFEVFDGAPTSRSTYRFEGADSVAGDDSTGDFAMSLGTASRTNRVLETDGTNIYAQDRMLYLDSTTGTLPSVSGDLLALDRSFSIAAFLDPADFEARPAMTAVTVRGSAGAKFAELGVEPTAEGYEYVFKLWDATSESWTVTRLEGEDGYLGTTVVIATFDPLTKTMKLSMPERGGESTAAFEGSTPTTLGGQTLLLGADTAGASRWTGGLDNLVVARGALSGSEISDLLTQHETTECFETEGGCQ